MPNAAVHSLPNPAETGNDVPGANVDERKLVRLGRGEIPIYEPGLEPLLGRNLGEGWLRFTTDVGMAVRESDIIFIAVGTPEGEDNYEALEGADALMILTKWQPCCRPGFERARYSSCW